MLVTLKSGSIVHGHGFPKGGNFNVSEALARELLAAGTAEIPKFDANGRCSINTNFDAVLNQHGVIEVLGGGEMVTVLPGSFPLEHLPAAVSAFQDGHSRGAQWGRLKLQQEFRELLDVEQAVTA